MHTLTSTLPRTPPGFDARVYLSAQLDVSGLNDTIRRAMLGIGMTPDAVDRRGTIVSTLMDDVVLDLGASTSPSNLAFACEFLNENFAFSSCNLREGDRVRLQRQGGRGDIYAATVTSVRAPAGFAAVVERAPPYLGAASDASDASDASGASDEDGPLSKTFTLVGIRVYDAERQALVAYVRNSNLEAAAYAAAASAGTLSTYSDSNAISPDDTFIRPDFDLDTYRAVYPETRALSLPDAYLDYRTRWKRRSEYRVIKGRDMFNLAAPYTSNLLFGGTSGGQNFVVYGDLSAAALSLRLSASNVYYDGTMLVGGVAPSPTSSNPSTLPPSNYSFVATSSNVFVGTAAPYRGTSTNFAWLPHAGPGGAGTWSTSPALASLDCWLSNCPGVPAARLISVANDDGTTPCLAGGAVDIAGGFLHAQPDVLAVAGGAVVVVSNGDMVCGGDASNLAVLNSNQVTQLNAACLVVSSSNAVIADYLTVGRPGTGLGRVGIGMECLGDEWGTPDGWDAGVSDPANFDLKTRLAVAGDVYATGTIVTLSDARVKSDLRPIGGALAKVLSMGGYTYAIDTASGAGSAETRRHTGLIAQDVEAALPEAVYRTPSNGMKSVAYGNLAGLFVEAFKELYSILERGETLLTSSRGD